ncbi:hypothetical protein L227DRAFT_258540 [Lentinus tigrinus ALCF2SS1-6]|uniref:Uncharacterized protein n=1 Tax=Lentinus tigrinus ALCF2SS1-6 TaxID=1328759 RepID=A0A5C2RZC5_9APHY|nr:hypothetical protein L227DRAFT_258540 [Lentinus tigrinus ALCF2SS1-6]
MYGRSFRFFLSFSFLSSPLLPSASVCFAADSEFVCINEKVCVWTYTLYADVTHCTARRARDARPQGSTEGSEVGYLGWEAKNRMHMDMSLPLPLLVKKGYDIGSVQRYMHVEGDRSVTGRATRTGVVLGETPTS